MGTSLLQQTPAALGPILTVQLHLSRAELGLLTSAIWGGMLLGTLPVGLLTDRIGERRIILVGVTGMAVMVLVASRGHSFYWLFGFFLLASVGASSSSPGGSKAIASYFPRHQRGVAMGIRQTGVMAGGLLAAVLLPPFALALGWPAGLVAGAVFCLLTVLVFAFTYREPPHHGERPPRLRLGSLFGTAGFVPATCFAFVMMGALGATSSYLTLFMHEQAGLTVVAAGAFLALLQLGGLVGRLAWGALSDRIGRRGPAMTLAGVLGIGSCAAMAFTGRATPLFVLGAVTFLVGLSTLGWNALYLTLLAELVPIQSAASAIGTGLTISFSAMFLVSPLFGVIADATGSYRLSWTVLAAWVALGTAAGLLVNERLKLASEVAI